MVDSFAQDTMPETGCFDATLGQAIIQVQYKIYADHRAKCTFAYLGTIYTFEMKGWSRTKFSDFLIKFHGIYSDPVKFGQTTVDVNGTPTHVLTPDQDVAVVCLAVQDCFKFLNQLLHVQKGKVVDYALWYREKYSEDRSTYGKYIELVVCHCVVDQQFIAGSYDWKKSNFLLAFWANCAIATRANKFY